jgi:hypothetical protein
MTDKQQFIKAVTVLIDTREQNCQHITDSLTSLGVKYERRKLDIGDSSFTMPDRDFSLSCVVERKADVDEIYGNIMEKCGAYMNRLEKELDAGCRAVTQFVLLIEGVGSMTELRDYVVPEWAMKMSPDRKLAEIGKPCYDRLRAWQGANRYNFRIECIKDKSQSAARMLEEFYYYWHNYKALIAPRRK